MSHWTDPIRERVDAATEGPWDHFRSAYLGNLVHRIGSASDVDDVAFVPCSWGHEADAEFISNARQDIPNLLAVIDRVLELHRPETQKVLGMSGPVGVDYCGECGASWPCPTILAVDGDS